MARYKVIRRCFFGGCLREPGHHSVVTHEFGKDDKIPPYLELIEEEKPKKPAKGDAE